MVMALMEGGAEEVTRAVIDAAKAGDLAAARLVIERLAPPLRERPLSLPLPDTGTVAGVSAAQQAILQAVGEGEILPGEGTALAGIVESRRKALETVELEQRISALEARHGRSEMRVGRLEAKTMVRSSQPYIRFIAEPGESSADCIRRHGHDPDAPGARYIVRLIIEPEPRATQLCGGDHAQD